MCVKKVLTVITAAAMITFPFAAETMAHAKLVRAEPAPGSVQKAAPKVVRLQFELSPGEYLDAKRSTLRVLDRHGRRVDDGQGGVDLNDMERASMVARLTTIGPGTYRVHWKAVSSPDLDVRQGSFPFTVAASTGSMAPMTLPPLKTISPVDGAKVRNPVVVIFETPADLSKMTMRKTTTVRKTTTHGKAMEPMGNLPHLHIDLDKRSIMPSLKHLTQVGPQRYQFSFGKVSPGRHTIKVYWADAKRHKPMGQVEAVTITVE